MGQADHGIEIAKERIDDREGNTPAPRFGALGCAAAGLRPGGRDPRRRRRGPERQRLHEIFELQVDREIAGKRAPGKDGAQRALPVFKKP